MSEETNVAELDPELEKLAGQLDGLTLLQASQLVKHLEDLEVLLLPGLGVVVDVAAAHVGFASIEVEPDTFAACERARTSRTESNARSGDFDSNSATTPVTCADAIELPERKS